MSSTKLLFFILIAWLYLFILISYHIGAGYINCVTQSCLLFWIGRLARVRSMVVLSYVNFLLVFALELLKDSLRIRPRHLIFLLLNHTINTLLIRAMLRHLHAICLCIAIAGIFFISLFLHNWILILWRFDAHFILLRFYQAGISRLPTIVVWQ